MPIPALIIVYFQAKTVGPTLMDLPMLNFDNAIKYRSLNDEQ